MIKKIAEQSKCEEYIAVIGTLERYDSMYRNTKDRSQSKYVPIVRKEDCYGRIFTDMILNYSNEDRRKFRDIKKIVESRLHK